MSNIMLYDYFTASGKYPEREKNQELTNELKINATKLLVKVNAFLEELGVNKPQITSGFRPSTVNASVPNSAKRSLHMKCMAIDIYDPDGSLDKLVSENDELKKKYGLWQENPESTNGWCHLDTLDRGVRQENTFKV